MDKIFKKCILFYKKQLRSNSFKPVYRLIEILQDEDDKYIACIQVINKNVSFFSTPEEILVNDDLVDRFSPRDIRTLTYLGYLGINSPKYKILAQRFIDDNKIVFAIKKKGDKNIIVKTAHEIFREQEIISKIASEDTQAIGYALSSEK